MKKTTHPRIASLIFENPLMIVPRKLRVIVNAIAPRIGVDDWPMDEGEDPVPGRQANPSKVQDGIAVIDIYGSLVKRCSGLDAQSGMTSYGDLQNQIKAAAADARIGAILLDVDSFGGECSGAFDLSDLIYEVRKKIPVYAVANSHALSAGYIIASAAERVFVTQDGAVGSVGVIAIHCDQSGFDEKAGLKYTAITYGDRKNDFSPHEPLSDEAAAELKVDVDRLGELFVSKVARNRGMAAEVVRGTQAKIYPGADAIPLGLADQIGTIETALAALSARLKSSPTASAKKFAASASAAAIPPQEVTHVTETTRADAETGTPPDAEVIRKEATAAGREDFKKTKTGIEALCAIAGPKYAAKAAEFIAAGKTVDQVSEMLLAERVAAAGVEEIITQAMPADGANAKPKSGSLIEACKHRAAQMVQKVRG